MQTERKFKVLWYRRSGCRVSKKLVAEAHARAVHAKRYGQKSAHALPGMSAQPALADALERMSDEDWASYSGSFVSRRIYDC